ncbi:MAG: GNAT family N-acetyltransferase [Dehalococcoidia bacterium]|nr:GNAT family N-acetyltransferase [Dehalococcoidia bacterium]
MVVEIALATRGDLPDIVMLVRQSGLSAKGLETCRLVLKATTDGRIVGTGAVEVLGKYAFCRSLAVERSQRGNGVGTRMVRRWLELCREEGLETAYPVTRRWHAGYFTSCGGGPGHCEQTGTAGKQAPLAGLIFPLRGGVPPICLFDTGGLAVRERPTKLNCGWGRHVLPPS